jgi:hypothetical protein
LKKKKLAKINENFTRKIFLIELHKIAKMKMFIINFYDFTSIEKLKKKILQYLKKEKKNFFFAKIEKSFKIHTFVCLLQKGKV